jgi:hypothetical protein
MMVLGKESMKEKIKTQLEELEKGQLENKIKLQTLEDQKQLLLQDILRKDGAIVELRKLLAE